MMKSLQVCKRKHTSKGEGLSGDGYAFTSDIIMDVYEYSLRFKGES